MIGHTAAWKVSTVDKDIFRSLRTFCGSNNCLDAAISRHQLKIAIRKTNDRMDARLRLVRRDIVDAGDTRGDALPIIATAGDGYALERSLFGSNGHARHYETLAHAYAGEQETVHSTVVAEVVKRYVRGRLMAFPLREHGGVYFVSVKRADELFQLKTFLSRRRIGSITHFRVMGDGDEIDLLTEEIKHLIGTREEALRETIQNADLSLPKKRRRMAEKIKELQGDLNEMKALFSFAAGEIERGEEAADELLRETIRSAPPTLAPVAA